MSCEIVVDSIRRASTADLIEELKGRPDSAGILADLVSEALRKKLAPQKRHRIGGQCKLWNVVKKWGILTSDMGDVFVHISDLEDGMHLLEKDQVVTFEPIAVDRGYKAIHVKRAEP